MRLAELTGILIFIKLGLDKHERISPEYYYQQRAEVPTPSPHLQTVITDLAEYHEVDLSQAGVHFTFALPEQDTHWLISNHKGKIDVARFAEQFGGGGHARAAGLKIEATFAEACERVVGAMLKALDR